MLVEESSLSEARAFLAELGSFMNQSGKCNFGQMIFAVMLPQLRGEICCARVNR